MELSGVLAGDDDIAVKRQSDVDAVTKIPPVARPDESRRRDNTLQLSIYYFRRLFLIQYRVAPL